MQSDPDWKGIMMWHSGISGLQFLLLILLSSVSIGTSDPDVKRSLLVADDLQNCPTQHCYQGSSHYRNEDLGNGNDLAARSEAQTSGQFLSADRRDNWQQFPKQSRAALFLRPTMPLKPQNFFKQSKLDAIASTPERVLQSFSASSISRPSSSSSVFSRTSFPSSTPVYHVPVYFPDAASTKTRMPFLAPIYPPANSETSKLHGPQTSIHLDRAAPVGPLSPSTLLSQSGHSPSNAVLAVTPDILDNSKLAPSITMSGPVTEPPPIFLGNLPPDVPQLPLAPRILPLAPRILHTPNIASPLPPSFAVQPSPPLLHSTVPSFVCMQPAEDRHSATVSTSLQGGSADSASVTCRYPMHPYTSKLFISKLQLDPMPPIATSRFSVPPIFPPEVPIRSLISRASAVNVSFWVFPPRSSQQAPTYPRAPYVFSPPPRSVTTGRSPKFPLIQAVSSPYDSVKSETLLPPVQKDDSPERLHFEQFAPSLVPTQPLPVTAPPSIHSRDGKLHEPSSQSFQTPKSQRSVRFLPPSNAWPLVVFPPVTSDRKPLQGPSVHKIQAPEVSFLKDPPSLSPAQPLTIIAPPLVSPHRYQHPAMPDSSNSSTKQMPPRPFGASSHAWAPLTHSGTSGSPAGPVPSPINRPLESPSVASRATFTPLTIFPSHSHHPGAKGPAASPEGIACSEQPWKKPITLVATPPGKRPWGHVRVAPAPEIQGSVASPPNIAPSEHPQKKPSMPAATPPSNRSKTHALIEISPMTQVPVFYSSITLPPEPQPGNSRTPALTPTMIFPSPSHCPGPVGLPPSVASSEPPLKKPRIPVAAPPRKTSQRSSTVGIPTMSQGPVPSPTNFPLQSPSGTSRIAFTPSMAFPSHSHHPGDKGIASSPSSVASSESPWNRPITPVATPRRKRSWRHVPVAAAPKNQGPVSSNFTPPSEPHRGSLRSPTSAPSRIFPSPPYHEHLKGPFASPPSINVPEPPQRTPEIPVAVPVHKRSRRHPPVAIPSMNPGPVPSPMNFPLQSPSGTSRIAFTPSMIFPSHAHHPGPASSPANSVSSESPWNRPIVPVATPRRKRSRWHVPVAAAPKNQGPAYSNFTPPSEPHKGSSRSPTSAPSRIFPSPPYHEHLKGPFASPPSINVSEPPQRTPEIPVAVPVHKRSRRHSPVAIPPMSQGSVSSPPITLPPTLPVGNSRNHVFAPPTVLPTPLRHAGVKGPVASPPSIAPSGLPQKKPRVPVVAPPSRRSRKHAPVAILPRSQGSVSSPPITLPPKSPSGSSETPTFTPSITFPSPVHHQGPVASPSIAPSEPPQRQSGTPVPASPMIFPSPPPDQDCTTISCADPFTYSPPGSPCGCVIPMQVELGLGVALYAFFPLVSELAAEVAAGTYLKQSQVRIMGANADNQDQEKTLVIIDLVPLGQIFDNTTALLIYKKFWQRKVIINETLFGDYRVIYVRYPGLPMPPPSAFSNASLNDSPVGSSNGPSKVEPFGANIRKRSDKMGSGTIAVIALSSAIAAVICLGAVWIILLKCSNQSRLPSTVEPTLASSITKRSGGASILSGSLASSASMSFASSMATYTGSAKTFTLAELEKATDRFNPENILGEGGFGRVYRGALEDGMKVAVKVLTRDDQQGGREFIAEVEMLSRLHHRNLVKLIGICTEEHNRSLVYELIPNGSVESHLHGLDKETAPLDWDARMKIALGAARGLAYLHEDSSPRVIHRDFKASNILLEDDFTPKVSDFGLAKAASEEGSGHISTRVMGTFGYVAPEYAMTGHLLVKSDVYSYGVVLLELLSGRKPVDMSQPPGQENLVTWARSLLTSKEGLETLKDPALGGNVPFDNMARVAAIASMCVQPEVSHRPFMGEVVQALKLVYNDSDASNGGGSGSCSQGGESSAHDNEVKDGYGQTWCPSTQYVPDSTSFVTIDYDSGPLPTQGLEAERPLSASALLSTSGRFVRQLSGSFRRHSSSGPLRTRRSKPSWYGVRGLARGSISEHHLSRHLGTGIDGDIHELWP